MQRYTANHFSNNLTSNDKTSLLKLMNAITLNIPNLGIEGFYELCEANQKKMQEYINNGVRLGWLLDPQHKTVEIFRLEKYVEILESPTTLFGEDVLPGFELNLNKVW